MLEGNSLHLRLVVISKLVSVSCVNVTFGLAGVKGSSWLTQGWVDADRLGKGAGVRCRDGSSIRDYIHTELLPGTSLETAYVSVCTEPTSAVLFIDQSFGCCMLVCVNTWVSVPVCIRACLPACVRVYVMELYTADGHVSQQDQYVSLVTALITANCITTVGKQTSPESEQLSCLCDDVSKPLILFFTQITVSFHPIHWSWCSSR